MCAWVGRGSVAYGRFHKKHDKKQGDIEVWADTCSLRHSWTFSAGREGRGGRDGTPWPESVVVLPDCVFDLRRAKQS